MAEYYHILDYKALSPSLVSTLFLGLPADSRTKRKLTGAKLTTEEMLLAAIFDQVQFLCWTKTKDAQHNRNRPKSLLKKLMGEEDNKEELMSFATPEEYEEYMRGLTP